MATATIFSGFNQPVENRSLILILNDIRNGKYKAEIEHLRTTLALGDSDRADQLKKQLPAFTPSGTYEGGRKAHLLKNYSGYVHLDFDKLAPALLDEAFESISKIPYTFGCFRSPSGNGLKVFIEVNTTAVHQNPAYRQVQDYYEQALGIPCDPKCKDITRLCFVSDDPAMYKNIYNEKFMVQLPASEFIVSEEKPEPPSATITPVKEPENLDSLFIFEQQIQFTNQKETYIDGNRNNYIYLLASNCNRAGLPESDTLDFCLQNFDLAEKEVRASVRSAYTNHSVEFAKFAESAKSQTPLSQTVTNDEEDYLKSSPLIPATVYSNLPLLLQSGAAAFADPRERDVFLTGALAILSGCLPKVRGIYAQQTTYPNLFAFVIAPAASGKGAMKFAKMLADKHHEVIIRDSQEAKQRFDAELNQYKARERSRKKGEPSEDPPEAPPFRVLYIPANTSYAKILTHLEQNGGEGIICETEADTMGNVLKQEWGGYSDLLRKAFHHERVSSSKKTNNEYIEINEPRLSVALSGTPSQVTGLINSAEDGLFSRFIFYAFKVEQRWRDVSPYANNINLTTHFTTLSQQTFDISRFLQQYPTIVELSRAQWDRLNAVFDNWLYQVVTFNHDEAASIVKRLGSILYRIAMIFTALRKVENGDMSQQVTCTDIDFETSLSLADLYLHHSLLMFHNLPRQNETAVFKNGDNKRRFFEALPDSFKRAEAIDLGKTFNLSIRSVDGLLKELIGRYLAQPQFGCYQKSRS